MSKDTRVRKKSTGLIGLVSNKKLPPTNFLVRNPRSYIELAIQEVGIPLTVKLLEDSREQELLQENILTIHQQFELLKLECVRPTGEYCDLPAELPCRVNYTHIDKSTIYHTAADVRDMSRYDYIKWIVVTRPFVYQAFVYNPGVIFEVLDDESCEGNLSVEVHPGRLLVFLPLQMRGEFRKCNSPYHDSECDLTELLDEEAPFFITPTAADTNKLYVQNIEISPERLFVQKKKIDQMLIASTNTKEELPQIHIFPVNFPLKCEILLGGIPVDILTKEEINTIKRKLVLCDQKKLKHHLILNYEYVGLTRKHTKRNGRLKKKDIRGPQALENTDYTRYIQSSTDILRELNLNYSSWGNLDTESKTQRNSSCSSPELSSDNSRQSSFESMEEKRKKRRSADRRSIQSLQFENLTVEEVVLVLSTLSLEAHAQTIRNEQINGRLLTIFDTNDFVELGLARNDAEKLYTYVNGFMFGNDGDKLI